MCHGKKIPSVKNGKFTCKRNTTKKNGKGDKKGKGRKCNLSCDKGYKSQARKGWSRQVRQKAIRRMEGKNRKPPMRQGIKNYNIQLHTSLDFSSVLLLLSNLLAGRT